MSHRALKLDVFSHEEVRIFCSDIWFAYILKLLNLSSEFMDDDGILHMSVLFSHPTLQWQTAIGYVELVSWCSPVAVQYNWMEQETRVAGDVTHTYLKWEDALWVCCCVFTALGWERGVMVLRVKHHVLHVCSHGGGGAHILFTRDFHVALSSNNILWAFFSELLKELWLPHSHDGNALSFSSQANHQTAPHKKRKKKKISTIKKQIPERQNLASLLTGLQNGTEQHKTTLLQYKVELILV